MGEGVETRIKPAAEKETVSNGERNLKMITTLKIFRDHNLYIMSTIAEANPRTQWVTFNSFLILLIKLRQKRKRAS